jgi:hypothetical protein
MKVGLSFSRCVLDIIEGRVDIADVLVVVARTDFDPTVDSQWKSIWNGYHSLNPEWGDYEDEDEDRFRSVAIELWETGKLHQPRKFGAFPARRPEFWLETVLVSEEIESRPAVKAAWDNFQVVAGLTNTKLDKNYQ